VCGTGLKCISEGCGMDCTRWRGNRLYNEKSCSENPLTASAENTLGASLLCFRGYSLVARKTLSARNSYCMAWLRGGRKVGRCRRLRSIDTGTRIEGLGNRVNLCGAQVAYRRPTCSPIVNVSSLPVLEVCNQQVHARRN
jgi:hypothetical protein